MAAPRPLWKGFLKLSLVSCPIELYPAISPAERISFRQVNRETGNRLRQQLVDVVTGEPVERHNKTRGYQVGENQFLTIENEELEAAREEARSRPFSIQRAAEVAAPSEPDEVRKSGPGGRVATREVQREEPPPAPPPPGPVPAPVKVHNTHTIEIERFVPRDQLDPRYFDTPYYIAPRDVVAQEAYAVIRDAMLDKGMIAMGHVVLAKRERPIIIIPGGKGLLGMTLHYNHEVRSEADYFSDIQEMVLPDDMLQIAGRIIDMKTANFDPAQLEDRYRTVLVSMLRDKQAKLPKQAELVAPKPQNVVSLMDVLKRSLSAEKPSGGASLPKPTPRHTAANRKAVPARRSPSRARKAS
jgi:non-homologous end joining protein Ku